jgi:hypothetical protein
MPRLARLADVDGRMRAVLSQFEPQWFDTMPPQGQIGFGSVDPYAGLPAGRPPSVGMFQAQRREASFDDFIAANAQEPDQPFGGHSLHAMVPRSIVVGAPLNMIGPRLGRGDPAGPPDYQPAAENFNEHPSLHPPNASHHPHRHGPD